MKHITEEDFKNSNSWGLLTSIDLPDCNPATIRDAEKIASFVRELCDRIKVKRFGDCQVVHFGEDPRVSGFSMVQLIETSLISGHFANETNTSYIDVFSCKYYDPDEVVSFTTDFFEGDAPTVNVILRS